MSVWNCPKSRYHRALLPLAEKESRPDGIFGKDNDPAQAAPWENGYCESFNGKLRDELLNGEIFYSLKEAQVVIEKWRVHYNTRRPHSALGYRPPAPLTIEPAPAPLDQAHNMQ